MKISWILIISILINWGVVMADTAEILPGSGPGSYEIKSDTSEVRLNFEYFGENILIRGKMQGKEVNFLIDNGSLWDQVWFYAGEDETIGLRYKDDEEHSVTGIGKDGGSSIYDGEDIDIDFGEIIFHEQPCLISPPESGFGDYFPGVAGQVCSLFFKHFVVKFDFENMKIILTKPEEFEFSGTGAALPMSPVGGDSYSVPFRITTAEDVEIDINLDIDLGTIYNFYLIENESYGIKIPVGVEKTLIGYGASGALYGYQGVLKKVQLGDFTLQDIPAEFVQADASLDNSIVKLGTFGLPLMKRFNITFDYFNKVMYFEKRPE